MKIQEPVRITDDVAGRFRDDQQAIARIHQLERLLGESLTPEMFTNINFLWAKIEELEERAKGLGKTLPADPPASPVPDLQSPWGDRPKHGQSVVKRFTHPDQAVPRLRELERALGKTLIKPNDDGHYDIDVLWDAIFRMETEAAQRGLIQLPPEVEPAASIAKPIAKPVSGVAKLTAAIERPNQATRKDQRPTATHVFKQGTGLAKLAATFEKNT
jgi:hypothetical protein